MISFEKSQGIAWETRRKGFEGASSWGAKVIHYILNNGERYTSGFLNIEIGRKKITKTSSNGKIRKEWVANSGTKYQIEIPILLTSSELVEARNSEKIYSRKMSKKNLALFSGFLKCSDCNCIIIQAHSSNKEGRITKYYMPAHCQYKIKCSSNRAIPQEFLNSWLWKLCIARYIQLTSNNLKNNVAEPEELINKLVARLDEIEKAIQTTLILNEKGLLTADSLTIRLSDLLKEKTMLIAEKEKTIKIKSQAKTQKAIRQDLIDNMIQYTTVAHNGGQAEKRDLLAKLLNGERIGLKYTKEGVLIATFPAIDLLNNLTIRSDDDQIAQKMGIPSRLAYLDLII